MRSFLLFIFSLATPLLQAQTAGLELYGQPKLEQGISIVPYALVYEDPSGDTTQPLNEVVKQSFIPFASSQDHPTETDKRGDLGAIQNNKHRSFRY